LERPEAWSKELMRGADGETGKREPLEPLGVEMEEVKVIKVPLQGVMRSIQGRLNWEARGRRWEVVAVRELAEGYLAVECKQHPSWEERPSRAQRPLLRPRVLSEEWWRRFRVSVEEELSFFPDGLTKNTLHRRVGGTRTVFYRGLGQLIEEGVVGMRNGKRGAHIVFLNNGGE